MALTKKQIERAKAIRGDIDGRIADNAEKPEVLLNMIERIKEWKTGAYEMGDVRKHSDILYRCIQTHTASNPIHTPDITPALWVVIQIEPDEDEILNWVAGEAVETGDLRMYNGVKYQCISGHTTQAGWTPPAVPALWKAVVEVENKK